ncbi:type II toxin-antitoxin system RnlA family toxin [Ruegeria faecimaris]|uniref:type II toxin-antitoxin system RnlA family toxin n=1 Tax=Ruegeria faecimaris TaxID=686389 RepID=UPI002491DF4F|nr:type II toxin-antitoxin system RnlA family toxin [Ruegeria faecimaris]
MSDYKDINLERENLDKNIQSFTEEHGYTIDGGIRAQKNRKRVVFGSPGAEFATVDFLLNKAGTTTILWKMGKNQPLGEQLAVHLKATINPAEFEAVNFGLSGITVENFDLILELANEADDIEITINRDEPKKLKQVTVKSAEHQDTLKLTLHLSTRKLQIQGKPLSCYRRIIFLLTDFLDLQGLEQVLYRKDDSSASIVRKEMAEDYLRGFFPDSYDQLPNDIEKLLISSCCVKLAAPQLPDYCLLLYPDLRSLEGILKLKMADWGMSVQDAEHGFGDFFDVDKPGKFKLKPEYEQDVPNKKLVNAVNNGYIFYRKHRHAIFHMEEFANGSRMITTLDSAIGLSRDAYAAIDALMQ